MANFNDLTPEQQARAMKLLKKDEDQKLKDMRYYKRINMQVAFAKSKGFNPTDAEVDVELKKVGKLS